MLVAVVAPRGDIETPRRVLVDARERKWQDQLNLPGSGSLVLMNDDPALADVHDDDIIQFQIDGTTLFAFIVRSRESKTIQSTLDQQRTTIAGPGLLALLDEAVVYPSRGLGSIPIEETRLFSWPSPDYDDSGWDAPISFGYTSGNTTRGWYGIAAAWPSGLTNMIWASGATTDLADGGWCYFRKTFNVGALTRARITFVADDIGNVYLDGACQITGNQWGNVPGDIMQVDVDLGAGDHVIALEVRNSDVPAIIDGLPFNPAMVSCDVRELDPFGNLGAILVGTDTTWKILAYPPTPPGMTPGEVLRIVISEAQARGCLAGITLNFTDDDDTNATPWPIVGNISTKVGNDILTMIGEMVDSYCDVALDPQNLQLSAWHQDGRGSATGVVLESAVDDDPMSGNLKALTHRVVQ